MRRLVSLILLGLLVQATPGQPPAEKLPDPKSGRPAPNVEYTVLDKALKAEKAPADLGGFKLIAVALQPSGRLDLAGLAASDEQVILARRFAVQVLTEAIEKGQFVRPEFKDRDAKLIIQTTDTKNVRIGTSPVEELLVLEGLISRRPGRILRAQYYQAEQGLLVLSGIVESEAVRKQVVADLERLPILQRVDATNVLVRQSSGLRPGEPAGTLLDAYDALGRCDAHHLLLTTTAVIRNAAPGAGGSASAWYLRAAAHLGQGRRQEAVGDLRVAHALAENLVGADPFFTTLERVQGPMRIALSRLRAIGVRAAVSLPQ